MSIKSGKTKWVDVHSLPPALSAQPTSIKLAEDILTELSHRGPNPEAFRQRVLELAKRMESLSAQTPPAPPEFAELKEIPKLRMLARMTADNPCITNGLVAVTDAYVDGYFQGIKAAHTPPDIELISAKVHEQWMESKRAQGIHSRKSESGEELMVPYDQLSEAVKELDRGAVRAVLNAMEDKR